MEFPLEIQKIINEYAKPVTSCNWRQGSRCVRSFKYAPEFLISNKLSENLKGDYLWDSIISLQQGLIFHYINKIGLNDFWNVIYKLWLSQDHFIFYCSKSPLTKSPLKIILSLGIKTIIYK